MVPLRVRAELTSAPVMRNPIYLDALLLYGLGMCMGAARADGIEDPARVLSVPLPLAKVEDDRGWWYAASMVLPHGREQIGYVNRRPATEMLVQYSRAGRIDIGSGPDKALHIPYYRRFEVMSLEWTCIGDPDRIAPLLLQVHRLGALSKAHGWVKRWSVDEDPSAPTLDAYRTDARLRHLPLPCPKTGDGPFRVQIMALTPPYHDRARAVPCLQGWT